MAICAFLGERVEKNKVEDRTSIVPVSEMTSHRKLTANVVGDLERIWVSS